MRVLVINLARAPERRARMEAQLQDQGLDFEILTATDGRTLTEAERNLVDHKRRKAFTQYPLTDNEIGCWLSHRRAMTGLIEGGQAMAAVIEDDAALAPDFAKVLAAIEAHAGSFDVIDLHRNHKKDEFFVSCRPLLEDCALGRVGYAHMNNTAYVVSRQGALRFLAFAPRFVHAVDKELHRYWANHLDLYGLSRSIAHQDDRGHSYIEETRGQDRPAERPRYADADRLYWRAMRRFTRIEDSIRKRLYFPGFVRRGRNGTAPSS